MKELICIVCPRGCHLKVDDENGYKVTGHTCPKGEIYGREELLHPVRVVTSTVRVKSAAHPRCPVKTDKAIPREDVFAAMRMLDPVELTPPIKRGDTVVKDVLGSGASFIATRDLAE